MIPVLAVREETAMKKTKQPKPPFKVGDLVTTDYVGEQHSVQGWSRSELDDIKAQAATAIDARARARRCEWCGKLEVDGEGLYAHRGWYCSTLCEQKLTSMIEE